MDRIDHRVLPWVLWAVTPWVCACEATAPQTTDDGVYALQFQDIPVPDGLRLVERTSDSREIGEYRYGNFLYTGSMPLPEIATYLLERMPQHSWLLMEDRSEANSSRVLRFHRGKYVVDCVLALQIDARSRMEVAVRTSIDSAAPAQGPSK